MPISSGFSFYQTNYPSSKRIIRPQIVSRVPKFRENQQKKNSNGLFSNSKATAGGQLPAQRSTAVVKQTLRSDTFTLPTKRDERNFKVPKVNQQQNGSQRRPSDKPVVVNFPRPSAEKKPIIPMRKTAGTNSTANRQNLERKPVRFANSYNNTYYSPSSPPAYYPKTAPLADPLPRDHLERSRPVYRTNDDSIIHRQRDSSAYAYTDYQPTVSNNIPTTSYMTSLPPISQSTNPTGPTVIIRPKETVQSDPPTVIIHSKENSHYRPPTVISTVSNIPSYPSSAPFMTLPSSVAPNSTMFLPNSTIPSYYPNSTMFLPTTGATTQPSVQTFLLQPPSTSTMFLPNSNIPSYPQNSTMFLPTTGATTQPSVQTFLFQPPPTSTYLSQPFFYPMPFPKSNPSPMPPPPPPPPPPHNRPIISQSSSSSVSAPTTIKTENKTEEINPTIVFQPNTNNNKKNVTIQLKMLNEDYNPLQRTVRVIRDSPYREADDVYYIEPEPQRVIYEQPRRRTAFIRPPPVNEYVYMDESPSTIVRHHPPPPPRRSEVVYVDNDQPLEYEEEIVYVDNHNNEIEYIYDDEPIYHRQNYKKSRQPASSTNIVYQ